MRWFNKIVFIIRKDLEKDFKEIIGNRIEKLVHVEYAFQELADLPEGYTVPEGRKKPWGTGQAVLSIKGLVNEPFAVINADDYYGKDAFRKIHDYMVNEMDEGRETYDMCMAGFILANTLSDNGTVTRGVCQVGGDGMLEDVTETYNIERAGDGLRAEDKDGNPPWWMRSAGWWHAAFIRERRHRFYIIGGRICKEPGRTVLSGSFCA